MTNTKIHKLFPEKEHCPICNDENPSMEKVEEEFGFGKDGNIRLRARLNLFNCHKCDFTWFGEDSDDLKHAAVCRHLKKLTPDDIKGIREKFKLSKKMLAKLCGFTEMSVGRWEKGLVVQDTSNDLLLRILARTDGFSILEEVAKTTEQNIIGEGKILGFNLNEKEILNYSERATKFSLGF